MDRIPAVWLVTQDQFRVCFVLSLFKYMPLGGQNRVCEVISYYFHQSLKNSSSIQYLVLNMKGLGVRMDDCVKLKTCLKTDLLSE